MSNNGQFFCRFYNQSGQYVAKYLIMIFPTQIDVRVNRQACMQTFKQLTREDKERYVLKSYSKTDS